MSCFMRSSLPLLPDNKERVSTLSTFATQASFVHKEALFWIPIPHLLFWFQSKIHWLCLHAPSMFRLTSQDASDCGSSMSTSNLKKSTCTPEYFALHSAILYSTQVNLFCSLTTTREPLNGRHCSQPSPGNWHASTFADLCSPTLWEY